MVFQCINIRQVLREELKTEVGGFYSQGLRKCFLEISIHLEVLLAELFISVSNRYQKKTICFSRLGKKVTKCVPVKREYFEGL